MSDHLPECPPWVAITGSEADCICDRLRACERRARLAERMEYGDAFLSGVQAARDAVDRMGRYGTDEMEPWDSAIAYALAAIDALRGDA